MVSLDAMPQQLLIGNPRSEFCPPVLALLRERVGAGHVRQVTLLDALARQSDDAAPEPELVVVLQDWPDEYSVADANQLIARFPLSRLVCAYGPWCDSDGRSRAIWPLAIRVPVSGLGARLDRELHLLTASTAHSLAPLPLTASRSEAFEFDFGGGREEAGIAARIVIASPDRPWAEMIRRGLARCGVRLPPAGDAPIDVLIFDADPWSATRADSLQQACARHQPALVVACQGFPRTDVEADLRKHGATHLWFKLEPLQTLVAILGMGAANA